MYTSSIVAYASVMARFMLQSSRHNASEIQTICANVANFCGNGFNNTRGLDGETASKKANQEVAESYSITLGPCTGH